MKGISTSLKLQLALTLITTLIGINANATFTPVAIPATGTNSFNADVIANGIGLPTTSTSAAFDNSINNLVASNYQATSTSAVPVNSLPATISSLNTSGVTYNLVNVTTAGNNSLRLSGVTTGMLDFTNQTYIGDIYVLAAAGDAGTTNVIATTITVRFTDNTSFSFPSVNIGDWFNQTPVAIQGIGRVNRTSGVLDAATTANPRLYEFKFTMPFNLYTKQIKGITVQKTQSQGTVNVLAVTIDHQTCLPPAPTATGTTTVGTTINWASVTGSQGYEYAQTTTSTPPSSGTATSALTFSPSGLSPGTTYYFWVRNKCSATSFSIWSYVSVTTLPCPSAGAPTVGTNTPGTVTFSWPGTVTPGVTDYQYAATPTAAAPTTWSTTSALNGTVNGLTPGATYYAQVRSNCTSTQSGWQSVQFVNPFPPCYTPATLTISNVNMHGANIVWNKSTTVPPAQDYQYVVTTNTTTPTGGPTTPSTTDTFYTATQLQPNTKYYVWVRTHCGTTNYSGWIKDSFTTAPTCLSTTTPVVSNITATTADISWQNFPGIYGYEYLINFSPNAPTIPAVPVNFNAVSPVNLASGTTYYFHLRTRCDTFNFSPWIVEPFTTTAVCTDPSNLNKTGGTATSASFNWQAVPGAQNYQYSVTTGASPAPSNTYSTAPNATAIFLNPGTAYYFHVRAWCSGSDSSSWVSTPFNTYETSVGNISGNNGFAVSVFPNPAKDLLTIQIDGVMKGKGTITVYDLSGKLVRRVELASGKSQVNISDLRAGMYLLQYTDNETSGMMRIQKQ